MGKHVFICHSTHDKLIAEEVRKALESKDIQCWMAPHDIPPGAEWAEAIVDAVDNSSGVVLVLSSNSNSSPQVIREIGRAVSKNVPLIPFRIDDTPLSTSMEYFLSAHQWLDALEPPLERHFQKLTDTVQRLLAREAAKEKARQEAEAARAKRGVEEARKAQEAVRAKKEAEEAAKEKARRKVEAARAKRETEKARRIQEEAAKVKKEAEEAAKEAEERARREAEKARKAQEEAARAKKEAEEAIKERARQEAEAARARREAAEARKAREPAKAKKEAEEAAKEAEERARRETEKARKAQEEAAKAKKEAEEAAKEKARQEAEAARARREAEEARKAREAARAEVPAGVGKRIIKSIWLWVVVALLLVGLGIFTIPLLTTELLPPTPPTPTLTSPGTDSEPGPVLDDLMPTLRWDSVPDADYYVLTISKYPYHQENIIYYKQLIGTSHLLLSGTLADEGKYCWNVQAHGAGGLSDTSNTLYFQTPSTSSTPSPPVSGYVCEASTLAPISGAIIKVWDYSSIQTSLWVICGQFTTNSEGYYKILSLPPGEYALQVEAKGYATEWFSNTYIKDQAAPLLVKDSGVKLANFTLEVGGSISGKVIDDASQNGIYWMHIYAEDYNTHEWINFTNTNSDGTYTLSSLPAGSYRVGALPWVNGQSYVLEYYDNTSYYSAKRVVVSVGQDTPAIDFSLTSAAE
jgi:hypothetical protein